MVPQTVNQRLLAQIAAQVCVLKYHCDSGIDASESYRTAVKSQRKPPTLRPLIHSSHPRVQNARGRCRRGLADSTRMDRAE